VMGQEALLRCTGFFEPWFLFETCYTQGNKNFESGPGIGSPMSRGLDLQPIAMFGPFQ
jgi:hypothetical protein